MLTASCACRRRNGSVVATLLQSLSKRMLVAIVALAVCNPTSTSLAQRGNNIFERFLRVGLGTHVGGNTGSDARVSRPSRLQHMTLLDLCEFSLAMC